jgi:hypothetical protein
MESTDRTEHNQSKLEQILYRTENDINKRKDLIKARLIQSKEILDKYKYEPPKPKIANNKKKNTVLPLINQMNKTNPNMKKRKKYYVKFKKVKRKSLLEEFGVNQKGKSVLDDYDEEMTFDDYLKIQSRAERRLKPIRGDLTTEFFDYIQKINQIRTSVMEREVEKILDTEDRYNDEDPNEDIKVNLTDKGLNDYKWKNMFSLNEYQNFFLDEIKGKISSVNYRAMLKRFRQISKICFASGKINFSSIANNLGDY